MKKCKYCGIEKELDEFDKSNNSYRGKCKECRRESMRTGKPNLGRFQKGHTPENGFKKGIIAWNKGMAFDEWRTPKPETPLSEKKYWRGPREKRRGIGRTSVRAYEWAFKVKERDKGTCQKCGSSNDPNAHHIKPWKEDKSLRFEISNGITYCKSCHMRLEATERFEKKLRKLYKQIQDYNTTVIIS
jgi:hypothetical protein